MEDCKPVNTPIEPRTYLSNIGSSHQNEMTEVFPYRQLVGSLMYLATSTRPDIMFTVSHLSQFCVANGPEHWKAGKRVLRYLQGTKDYGLKFVNNTQPLYGVVDADWGSNPNDRHSHTGYAYVLSGAAVSWEAKKQRTVALSSTEAEYKALTAATKEAIYLGTLLHEIGIENSPPTIYGDNQGALSLAKNQVSHSKLKHVDIHYHFVKEAYAEGKIQVAYMPTEVIPADMLTKGVPAPKHKLCTERLGVHSTAEQDFEEGC